MKGKLPVKICDPIIITLALILTGFSFYSIYLVPQDTTRVLIEAQGRRWVYPLDAEVTLAVSGPLGNTIVKIHDEQAWVESSPCDNQICVAAGRLFRSWDFASCLPNNVLLVIEGYDGARTLDSTAW